MTPYLSLANFVRIVRAILVRESYIFSAVHAERLDFFDRGPVIVVVGAVGFGEVLDLVADGFEEFLWVLLGSDLRLLIAGRHYLCL